MGIQVSLVGGMIDRSFPSRDTPANIQRWLFVINAIITVVWGLLGFFMIPDLPNKPNPRAFWFSKADAELAVERLLRHNRADSKKMTWAGVR
jgi:hypothetical protein